MGLQAGTVRKRRFVHGDRYDLLILALVALAYGGVRSLGLFPWDDQAYLEAAASHAGRSWTTIVLGNHHPLTMCSYWLVGLLGNEMVAWQHVANVLLHAASALIVRRIVGALTGDRWSALAVLFAVHPMQVESVAWIAERKNVLYAFFYFLAVALYLRWMDRPTARGYALVMIAAIAAYLSKGQAVTLPAALYAIGVVRDRTFRIGDRWTLLVPLFLVSLGVGLLAFHAQQVDGYLHMERTADPLRSAVLACYALVGYALHLLVPIRLSIFYPFPSALTWEHAAAVVVVLVWVFFLWRAVRARHLLVVGSALFFVLDLLPVLQWVPVGEALLADRYAYVASVPFLIIVVQGLRWSVEGKAWERFLLMGAGALVVLAFMFATRARVAIWRDAPDLFERLAAQYPESDIAQFNLAAFHQRHAAPEEAIVQFAKVVAIAPDHAEAWYAMGGLLRGEKRYPEALNALDHAVKAAQGPGNAYLCYYERALCRKEMGRSDGAVADLDSALAMAPHLAAAHFLQGELLADAGHHEQAIRAYDQAERWGYDAPLVWMDRAISEGWLGRYASAVRDLDKVVQQRGSWSEAYFLRGLAKARSGQDGCPDLRRAVELGHRTAAQALTDLCGSH